MASWSRISAFLLLCAVASLLQGGVRWEPLPQKRRYRVVFSFQPPIRVQAVHLAGSFSQWQKLPMVYLPERGEWRLSLLLSPGKHLYKFVVNRRVWLPDPTQPQKEPDGFGGWNSVLILAKLPAQKFQLGDGKIMTHALSHRPYRKGQSYPIRFQDLTLEGRPLIRLATAQKDIEAVALVVKGKSPPHSMYKLFDRDGQSFYEIELSEMEDFEYVFQLRDGEKVCFFTPRGVEPKVSEYFSFRRAPLKSFQTPQWVWEAVFYQIFPDRFHNGDPNNDPPNCQPWGSTPTFFSFFGGDLEGIRQKIPYLQELGVNAIYLNPIFKAPSCHKYDASDYYQVDPHFGGNESFQKLVQDLKKAHISLILDGVFNHSGTGFFAFQDILRHQEKSRYKHWYYIRKFPVQVRTPPPYDAWWGFAHHPKLNQENPEVREYFLKVAEHWLKEGARGWRLDVPNEVDHSFWKEFRKRVKRTKADAYIVGEIWQDGRPWLQGDEFDGVMNYLMRNYVLEMFVYQNTLPSQFLREVLWQYVTYPQVALAAMLNMLSNHDVPRVLTLAKHRVSRVKLAAAFLFTIWGAPCIYYGDEIGMRGGKDPDNRRCFPWETKYWHKGLRRFYQRLIQIRKTHPALQKGNFRVIQVWDGQKAFVVRRAFQRDVVYLLWNVGSQEVKVSFSLLEADKKLLHWKDLLTQDQWKASSKRTLHISIPREQVRILAPLTSHAQDEGF